MNDEKAVYRRVLRRETHSPRTVAAVVVALALLLVLAAGAVLAVWTAIDPSLRDAMVQRFDAAASWGGSRAVVIVAGCVLVLIALLLVVLAVAPGRRPRRGRTTDRVALLVDDGVLADAAAERVARSVGVDRRQVSVTVGRRRVIARITPTSGVPVPVASALDALRRTMDDLGFPAEPRVSVAGTGTVG